MKTLSSMKEIEETSKYTCEFCNKEFARERTLVSHLCKKKDRWQSKDHVGNRIGFQSWIEFYSNSPAHVRTKNSTYEAFIDSPYYLAFVKYGTYCADVKVLNPSQYMAWLLKENKSIDKWATDSLYNQYLCDYLRREDAFDAIHRSVSHCIELAEIENIQAKDVLRYGNKNRICQAVISGKISPWMLYCSQSGIHFLETLNTDHVRIVTDYINPEQWSLKFHRDPDIKQRITDTLSMAGY